MGREEFGSEIIIRPIKADIGLFGERFSDGNSTQIVNLQNQSPRTRKLYMSEIESELSHAKKTVRELTFMIEESNSKAKLRMQETLKHCKPGQEQKGVFNNDNFVQYAELVMKDLEKVKRDLSKLKLEVKGALDEKNKAENEAKGLNVIIDTYSKSVYALRQEIEEVNDEQVLVELAEIEAYKELADIKTQKKIETQRFSLEIENIKRKKKEILEEIDQVKELERKLALTNTDLEMLENEIKMFKEMDIRVDSVRKENDNSSSLVLKSVLKELELAKNDLGSIREEGFQLMSSMDLIRNELFHVSEKIARAKKKEEKADQNAYNLDSKLLRAKMKLEAISSSEEKAKTIVENLFLTCKNLKTETEACKNEKELICKETTKIKAQKDKNEAVIELSEVKLESVFQELENVKSSELVALEKLKILTEKTVIDRAFRCEHSSTITISKFEYEYLKSRAAEAEEVADKKVLAAQAWIKAFKVNEEEIRMETDIAERKMKEKREKEDTERVMGEKPMRNSGSSTPVRRAKFRYSPSPGFRYTNRSSNANIKRRKKIMPNLGKLFDRKIVGNEW